MTVEVMRRLSRAAATVRAVLAVLALLSVTGGAQCASPSHPDSVPIATLAHDPDSYRGRQIKVSGRLRNLGTNYFTDRRIAVVDDGGTFVYVSPWLPIAVPPPRPGSGHLRPATLADFLGKRVELVGTMVRTRLKGIGQADALAVDSARILSDE